MSGNAIHRFTDTAILGVCAIDAPEVVTSEDFDARLADTYERVGLRPGMLRSLVGIKERRWWPEGYTFVDGAVAAGAKVLGECGVDPAHIGLMVNTSVSRRFLEPSTAVEVHHGLDLPSSCQNFDVTNACLGFVNGMELAATMIDAGVIDYAMVVDGEDCRVVQENTIARLSQPGITADDVMSQFAALTLGSGSVAMILGRAQQHLEGHRMVVSASRAGTEHHELCIGDNDVMYTDLRGLLDAGLGLSGDLWAESADELGWNDGISRYVIHQISQVHMNAITTRLGIDKARVPLTFPTRGNIGPASVPVTLACEADHLEDGDRVLLMGIGSGLNVSVLEIEW